MKNWEEATFEKLNLSLTENSLEVSGKPDGVLCDIPGTDITVIGNQAS